MNDTEIIQTWKDPEADRLEVPNPLGEPDLTAFTGGLMPITSHSGYVTWCGTCGTFTYGCC